MNVRVDPNRFLSVACEPDERIVFDRQETKYHLLRDSAARLWDEICEGGTFEIAASPTEGQDPVALLADAGLLGIADDASEGITRRVWLRRTGKVSAAAFVLPLVASIAAPRLALGQDGSVDEVLEPTGSNDTFQEPLKSEPQSFTETSSSGDKLSRDERREQKGGNGVGSGSSQTFTGTDSPGNSGGENGTRTRRRTGQQLTTTQTTQNGPSSTGLIKRRDRDR